jgi:hypothetical protein
MTVETSGLVNKFGFTLMNEIMREISINTKKGRYESKKLPSRN